MSDTGPPATWPRERFRQVYEPLRDAAGYKDNTAVARAAGIHPSTISNWFNERLNQRPTTTKLASIARVLKVDSLTLWEAAGILPEGAADRLLGPTQVIRASSVGTLSIVGLPEVSVVPPGIAKLLAAYDRLGDHGRNVIDTQISMAISWAETELSRIDAEGENSPTS